jgi:hypothetical protein
VCLMYLYGIDNETCCKCFKQGGRERWWVKLKHIVSIYRNVTVNPPYN